SLRVGVPNLAVGSVFLGGAVLSSMIYREQSWDVWPAVAAAVFIAALAGLLLGAVVSVLHVPAWAASLGAGLAVIAWTVNSLVTDTRLALAPGDGPDLFPYWEWIFLGIAGVSVLGGAIGAIGRLRVSWAAAIKADPGKRPGAVGVLASLGALTVSSALAAGAGGLLWIGLAATESSTAVSALAAPDSEVIDLLFGNAGLIVLVLATVLLGGVSAFGRRGGIFGTMLATLAMVLLVVESVFDFGSPYSYLYVIVGALLLGLVMTRVLEASCARTAPAPQPLDRADWDQVHQNR
ncbi:MAG: ABC transporter permease subunit, partial [Mycobacteriales bacterium]